MRPREISIAKALGRCSFPPATAQKRFARQMAHAAALADAPALSDRQSRYLCILVWRFRRQLPSEIIEAALDLAEERGLAGRDDELPARERARPPPKQRKADERQFVLPLRAPG